MISEINAERFNQEINTSEIDRILFRQSDCRYTYGVIIDHVFYDMQLREMARQFC